MRSQVPDHPLQQGKSHVKGGARGRGNERLYKLRI